ncbi:MAG: SGNH/GDSL hydrolase family protein [Jaaginema sp. PMC 1079.18]|nr:SGNH/GDSL hydrolase family protein [Jaaginema sp. PMC 1080.18]MEC4852315.1 SGNH/GDSL hydrolase family protein [Jaaginema sp. PMC 1079.18]MEC4865351.1 SGNH/GDSL hydrolase family protein [Jaaginema sp. PMC 1078.18]
MFRPQRRTFKSSRHSLYSKRRSRFPSFWLLLPSAILALVVLEFAAHLVIDVSGKQAELANYQGEPTLVNAYRLNFLTSDRKPYKGLSNRGNLLAQQSLGMGYELVGDRDFDYWQINEQGFRDREPLPLAKPPGEYRIFILGNSTAFGVGNSSNNATISQQLEILLNERVQRQKETPAKYRPDVLSFFLSEREKALALPPKIANQNYRVINAAVPGYTSGNHLAQVALKILPYQPDAIVVVGGYSDLILPSSETATNIPKINEFLTNPLGHYGASVKQTLGKWASQTATYRVLNYFILHPEPSLAQKTLGILDRQTTLVQHLPQNPDELQRRVDRYRNNYQQIVKLTAGAGIPLVVALQPEITGRNAQAFSATEKALYENLSSDYPDQIQQGYAALDRANNQLKKAYPRNISIFNFQQLYQNAENTEDAFTDPIHLTESANAVLAERLYQGVTALPQIQVIPQNYELTD